MEVFRLSRQAFSGTLSGKGAALKGARWNSAGVEVVYAASNRSLAMAEVAVHLSFTWLPTDYQMLTIYVPPGTSITTVPLAELPRDWNVFPHRPATQAIGDAFIAANKFCILQVPSAVTPGDTNWLMNPYHPEFARIQIIRAEDFRFDNRLFR
ncbi:MAG: RES domain-containing protein [Bacteroidetes bacterium]|nr:MAG: RES domain-containing protein [Bacteroidota bacterium]TAE71423.1 MAG: RES domain-containing protein [Bacteroidota bacterium]TAF98049.1 MAG: RES domain-containing protein [Bacteroidota bacterium]